MSLRAHLHAAISRLFVQPLANSYDRERRATTDPSYDRGGCWCASGPHHHPACPLRRTR